jgi:hypothetical protein
VLPGPETRFEHTTAPLRSTTDSETGDDLFIETMIVSPAYNLIFPASLCYVLP